MLQLPETFPELKHSAEIDSNHSEKFRSHYFQCKSIWCQLSGASIGNVYSLK